MSSVYLLHPLAKTACTKIERRKTKEDHLRSSVGSCAFSALKLH